MNSAAVWIYRIVVAAMLAAIAAKLGVWSEVGRDMRAVVRLVMPAEPEERPAPRGTGGVWGRDEQLIIDATPRGASSP